MVLMKLIEKESGRMKKTIVVFFFVVASIMLVSCNEKNIPIEDVTEPIAEDIEMGNDEKNDSETMYQIEDFDIYSMLEPSESEFNRIIANNDIDKNYIIKLNSAVTTYDFRQVELEYIEIWKKDLQSEVDILLSKLPKERAEEFSNIQDKWEEQMLDTIQADRLVIDSDTMGSAFEWQWLGTIREAYRERAIHIRYLNYLMGINDEDGSVS